MCNFNSPHKIEPIMMSIWMNILRRVPNATLWLLQVQWGVLPLADLATCWCVRSKVALLQRKSNASEARVLQQAAAFGVAPHRVVFMPSIKRTANFERSDTVTPLIWIGTCFGSMKP